MTTAVLSLVTAYADDVLAGKIPAGRWVRLACERHLADLENPRLRFDEAAADRAIRFIGALTLFEAQKPFRLEPWQAFIVGSLFGWFMADSGVRRFTQAYVEVGRGNGKSPLAAAIGLYMLVGLGVHGGQVFSAATTRDQARIVYRDAQNMVTASEMLKGAVDSGVTRLLFDRMGAVFRPLSAEASKMDGLRVLGAMVDELHEHPSDQVVTKLRTGMGKYAGISSLLFMITTAGYDRNSVCWEQHDYICKILEDLADDDRYFGFVASIDEGDDWTDEAVWYKPNPNLGISISLDTLRTECEQAKAMPAQQNAFKRLRLNVWTEQATRWLDMATWDAQPHRKAAEALVGKRAYCGIDLSSTTDITAVVFMFKDDDGGYDIFPYFFVPEENADKRAHRDRVPYPLWIEQGYIDATEGNVVDYAYIRRLVNDAQERLGVRFDLREIAIDRWNSTQLQTELMADGFTVVPFGQGFASMTAPTKEVERLLLDGKLRHGGNPVLRWMASNVSVRTDPAGNLKPDKEKSTERIDGIVAMVMSVGRAMVNDDGRSVYEDRGVISI